MHVQAGGSQGLLDGDGTVHEHPCGSFGAATGLADVATSSLQVERARQQEPMLLRAGGSRVDDLGVGGGDGFRLAAAPTVRWAGWRSGRGRAGDVDDLESAQLG